MFIFLYDEHCVLGYLHKNTEARNSRRCWCYTQNATIGACSGSYGMYEMYMRG
jgi:hypothetical protein